MLSAGCGTSDLQRLSDPNAYVRRANATFANLDIASRLLRTLELRDGDVSAPIRAAMRANQRVKPPKPLGLAANLRADPGAAEYPIVIVAVVIDAAGKPTDVLCQAAPPGQFSDAQLAYVEHTIREWQFEPATIDGQPVACTDSFSLETDGRTYLGRLRVHLSD